MEDVHAIQTNKVEIYERKWERYIARQGVGTEHLYWNVITSARLSTYRLHNFKNFNVLLRNLLSWYLRKHCVFLKNMTH